MGSQKLMGTFWKSYETLSSMYSILYQRNRLSLSLSQCVCVLCCVELVTVFTVILKIF